MHLLLDLHVVCGGAAFVLAPLAGHCERGDGTPALGSRLFLVHGWRRLDGVDHGYLAANPASGVDCHFQFLRCFWGVSCAWTKSHMEAAIGSRPAGLDSGNPVLWSERRPGL